MACRLVGAKPLPEPMLAYWQVNSGEQIQVKFKSESIFIQEDLFENVACQNGGHFVQRYVSKHGFEHDCIQTWGSSKAHIVVFFPERLNNKKNHITFNRFIIKGRVITNQLPLILMKFWKSNFLHISKYI